MIECCPHCRSIEIDLIAGVEGVRFE